MFQKNLCLTFFALGSIFFGSISAFACPFCPAVSQTFTEEIESMDAAVAKLVELPKQSSDDPTLGGVQAKFEIVKIFKGKQLLKKTKILESLYYGEGRVGRKFLMMATDPPNLMWSTPTLVTDRAVEYIETGLKLPESGAKRLEFFQNHLEDKDDMLARDAYDEFAKAPYNEVMDLKEKMDHDQLVTWIKNPDLPANRRRLYLTMLGVCGDEKDLDFLESLLKSEERKDKSGLDAMIGCYLTLAGSKGMPLIEDLYLKNKEAEYADTYAAIMAIRFHGTETDIIPRKRLLEGLHYMLDRPSLADLVIVDLARWEDWSVSDRLVELFKKADDDSSWVRVPVVRYLMACPKPEAKKYLLELEKIDGDAVKRAQTFFPFRNSAVPTREDAKIAKAAMIDAEEDDVKLSTSEDIALVDAELPLNPAAEIESEDQTAEQRRMSRSTLGDVALAESVKHLDEPTNPTSIFYSIIPLGLCFAMMLMIWGVLYTPVGIPTE